MGRRGRGWEEDTIEERRGGEAQSAVIASVHTYSTDQIQGITLTRCECMLHMFVVNLCHVHLTLITIAVSTGLVYEA